MLWNRISHPSPIVTRLRLRRRRPHPSPSSWEHYRHPPFSYQSYLFSFSIILPCRLVAARRATLPSSSSFFHGASGTGATSNGNDRARAAFYHRTGKHNGVSHRKLHGSHQIDRRHDWRVNLRQRPQNVSNVSDHQLLHPKPIRQHNPTRQSFSSQSDNGGTLTTTTPTPTTTPPAADQPHQLPSCHVRSALSSGPVPYEVGWAHQHVLLHHRLHCLRGPSPKRGSSHNDDDRDHLLLFEHQPVYTLGRGASEEHLSFLSRQPDGGADARRRLHRRYRGPDASRLDMDSLKRRANEFFGEESNTDIATDEARVRRLLSLLPPTSPSKPLFPPRPSTPSNAEEK